MVSAYQLAMVLVLSVFPLCISSQQFGPVQCQDSCFDSDVCLCDPHCEYFGDCCHDSDKLLSNITFPALITGLPLSLYQCRSVHVNRSIAKSSGVFHFEIEKAYWMVVKCLSSWQEEYIEAQCVGSGSSRQPVTDRDTGIVYLNEYCAICNGARVDRLVHWKYNLACSNQLYTLGSDLGRVVTQDILQQYCEPCSYIETDPLFVRASDEDLTVYLTFPRPCYISENTCLARDELQMLTHRNWSELEYDSLARRCENGTMAPVRAGEMPNGFFQLYKNEYCALCNGESLSSLSCPSNLSKAYRPRCEEPSVPPVSSTVDDSEEASNSSGDGPGSGTPSHPTDPVIVIYGPGTFSVVLDVTQDGLVLVESRSFTTEIMVTCTDGQVFDPVIQGCHPAVTNIFDCPEGCELLALNTSDGDVTVLANDTVQYGGEIYEIAGKVDSRVLICYNSIDHTYTVDVPDIIVCPEGTGLLALNVSDGKVVPIDNNTIQYGDEVYEIAGKVDSRVLICYDSYNGTFAGDVPDIIVCPEGTGLLALNVSDGKVVFIDNNTIQYGDEVYEIAGKVDTRVLICYDSFNGMFAGDVTVCPEGSGLLALNVSDSSVVVMDNNTVQYGDDIYNIAGKLDLQVLICLSFNGTYTVNVTVFYYEYPKGFEVATYIGSSLSVIGCIFVIVTYSLFKELRTLPGKLLMNLAATILVSNIFLLLSDLGSESQAYCTATAIILHMFFLAQFSWMTILVFETGRNFYDAQTLSSMEPSKQFYRRLFCVYLFLGWLTPAVIVGASIAANYLSDDDLVLYGKQESGRQGRCWINHLESAIIAFLLPVALSILFNATVVVVISVWIYKAWRGQAKLNRKSQNLYYLRVYFAVFAISGICWVFGFIAILADEEWAWYPFIVLNSIQGFVLFTAFVLTKKIGRRYQNSILNTYLIRKHITRGSKALASNNIDLH